MGRKEDEGRVCCLWLSVLKRKTVKNPPNFLVEYRLNLLNFSLKLEYSVSYERLKTGARSRNI